MRILTAFLISVVFTSSAAGASFTVNSTGVEPDATPGNGVCETAAGNGVCTLRAAIDETNALGGSNVIQLPAGEFSIRRTGGCWEGITNACPEASLRNNVTLQGAGQDQTLIRTPYADNLRIGEGTSGVVVTVANLTLGDAFGDRTNGSRAAVEVAAGNTAHLSRVTIRDNFHNSGNCAGVLNNGTATMDHSIVEDNYASRNGVGFGTGVQNAGTMTIRRSTIARNVAGTAGGGIFNNGTLRIENSTISGNWSRRGGGIWNDTSGTIDLKSTTVFDNFIDGQIGTNGESGGIANYGGIISLEHVILANNRGWGDWPNCGGPGPFLSLGYNLIDVTTGCAITGTTTGNIYGYDAALEALSDNGGPTPTHEPYAGSPVIDAGNPAGCSDLDGAPLLVDQRGMPRPVGPRCDIGAVEAAGQLPVDPANPRGDVDPDLRSDVFWRNQRTGETAIWRMDGTTLAGYLLHTVSDLRWNIAGVGDFDADGRADVLWRNQGTGEVVIWFMHGPATREARFVNGAVESSDWQIEGIGDLDGDRKADIVWRNIVTGQVVFWFMNGVQLVSTHVSHTVTDTRWRIVATGDITGDAKADLIWRHDADHTQLVIWEMNGPSTKTYVRAVTTEPGLVVEGSGDVNGDGRIDLVLRNPSTGEVVVYFVTPSQVTTTKLQYAAGTAWRIEAVGDFNGDGKYDLMWRNPGTGEVVVWLLAGDHRVQTAAYVAQVSSTDWQIEAPR